MKQIKEGNHKKGGVNKAPTCRRPEIKPPARYSKAKAGQHETIVIFDTPEKAEEGALLLSRIRQISQDQLSSKQVKRMNELIKATGFELHYRK